MTVLANAFKSASSGSSSSRVLLSEAAEVMLKVGTGASVLPFPWQASSPQQLDIIVTIPSLLLLQYESHQ